MGLEDFNFNAENKKPINCRLNMENMYTESAICIIAFIEPNNRD